MERPILRGGRGDTKVGLSGVEPARWGKRGGNGRHVRINGNAAGENAAAWAERDRRAVARYAGLTGSPDESGARRREQGLARAGNARVRRGVIKLAWRFLMFQKVSALALWYRARTADSRIGTRKTMIVAQARKLVIALWRFITLVSHWRASSYGQRPEGPFFQSASVACSNTACRHLGSSIRHSAENRKLQVIGIGSGGTAKIGLLREGPFERVDEAEFDRLALVGERIAERSERGRPSRAGHACGPSL